MTTATSTTTSLKDAIEARDADGVTAWYADNAVLTILDRDNPPAAPATYRGDRRLLPRHLRPQYRALRRRPGQHGRRAWLYAALSLSRRNPSRLRDRRSFGRREDHSADRSPSLGRFRFVTCSGTGPPTGTHGPDSGRTKDRANWKNAGPAASAAMSSASSLGGSLRILTLASARPKARNNEPNHRPCRGGTLISCR